MTPRGLAKKVSKLLKDLDRSDWHVKPIREFMGTFEIEIDEAETQREQGNAAWGKLRMNLADIRISEEGAYIDAPKYDRYTNTQLYERSKATVTDLSRLLGLPVRNSK